MWLQHPESKNQEGDVAGVVDKVDEVVVFPAN